MNGITFSKRKGEKHARISVSAPVITCVAELPRSSSNPSERVMTIKNLLTATARNVSASRHPNRRPAGNVASGTITGTSTSNKVRTTARTMSSHHSNHDPTTTATARTNKANDGTTLATLVNAVVSPD